jgi:large subunit ribosomal protein L29
MNKKVQEMRSLSNEEINAKVATLKEELFNLRFQLAVGQLTNTARIKQVKKAIARLLTVQSENANN